MSQRVQKMREYQRMRAAGDFEGMPKKEALRYSRELEKLERNLGGIVNMSKTPDAVFILDTKKEHIAVTEANKLGLPIVAVVDTNCDPDVIDYVIPGNDDAIRSGNLLCRVIADAVEEGRHMAARKGAGTGAGVPMPSERTAEDEARVAAQQAEARRQAALQAQEREARLAAARDGAPGSAEEAAPTEGTPGGPTEGVPGGTAAPEPTLVVSGKSEGDAEGGAATTETETEPGAEATEAPQTEEQ
jgi:small subunit ribosomal protein S2